MFSKEKSCSNCKHQDQYIFHANCLKGYNNCYNNGQYKLFEQYVPQNLFKGLKK